MNWIEVFKKNLNYIGKNISDPLQAQIIFTLMEQNIDHKISNKSCNDFCEKPWKEVYIRYNGDLTVCNMLNPYIYGNLKNYSFESIWNG